MEKTTKKVTLIKVALSLLSLVAVLAGQIVSQLIGSGLLAAGIPAEDARYLLPNAAETKIVITMNVRELLHFFSLRCCNRAQWEIRDMAHRMLDLAKPTAPFVFMDAGAPCVRGACPEGKMTCGHPFPHVSRG